MKSRLWKRSVVVALAMSIAVSGGSFVRMPEMVKAAEKSTSNKMERDVSTTEEGLKYQDVSGSENELMITGYTGNKENLVIPEKIDGKTVTEIGDSAFQVAAVWKV